MPSLSQGTLKELQKFPWPGNVRQLKRVLRLVIESGDFSQKNVRKIATADNEQSAGSGLMSNGDAAGVAYLDEDLESVLSAFPDDVTSMKRREIQEALGNVPSSTLIKRLKTLINLGFLEAVGNGPKTAYIKLSIWNGDNSVQ
jgi:DNA-binding NtrC family response regulator